MDRFERQLITHMPRLRRYAWALKGSRERADDLVQDCLARALSRRHLWIRAKGMRPWLFTIMHNIHVNDVSRDARAPQEMAVDDFDHLADTRVGSEGHQALEEIDQALQRLSPEHREIVLLVGLEQMPYKEASIVLDVPIGTVMSRLARAREQLREQLFESNIVGVTKIR
ncbi:MAG: RNA polymerase sigma factor [Gammaproteobacteria bacterium]|nr:RNA polymerase sigma factor [Gammaproteobacteria bacterium]